MADEPIGARQKCYPPVWLIPINLISRTVEAGGYFNFFFCVFSTFQLKVKVKGN